MRVRFIPPAKRELIEESRFYEARAKSLGSAFLDEVGRAINIVKHHPTAWALDESIGVRRARLARFPFSLVYRIEGDEVVVFAVAHAKRQPYYWQRRLLNPHKS